MREDELEQGQEDLLDLNAVMNAFGVSEWRNLGPTESTHSGLLSILVEIQGQRHILKERVGGFAGEDASGANHSHSFQRYLQGAGIPIPPPPPPPPRHPPVTIRHDTFQLHHHTAAA